MSTRPFSKNSSEAIKQKDLKHECVSLNGNGHNKINVVQNKIKLNRVKESSNDGDEANQKSSYCQDKVKEITNLVQKVTIANNSNEKRSKKIDGDPNRSTLSLYIETYENSAENYVETKKLKNVNHNNIEIMKYKSGQSILNLNKVPKLSEDQIQQRIYKIYCKFREMLIEKGKKTIVNNVTLSQIETSPPENELQQDLMDKLRMTQKIPEYLLAPEIRTPESFNIYMARGGGANRFDGRGLQNAGRDPLFYLDFGRLYYSPETSDGQLFVAGGVHVPNIVEARKQAWVRIHAELTSKGYTVSSKISSLQQRWREFVKSTIKKKMECTGQNGPNRVFSEAEQLVLDHTPEDAIYGTLTSDIGVVNDPPPVLPKRTRKRRTVYTPSSNTGHPQSLAVPSWSSSHSSRAAAALRRNERNDPDFNPTPSQRRTQPFSSNKSTRKKKRRTQEDRPNEVFREISVEPGTEEDQHIRSTRGLADRNCAPSRTPLISRNRPQSSDGTASIRNGPPSNRSHTFRLPSASPSRGAFLSPSSSTFNLQRLQPSQNSQFRDDFAARPPTRSSIITPTSPTSRQRGQIMFEQLQLQQRIENGFREEGEITDDDGPVNNIDVEDDRGGNDFEESADQDRRDREEYENGDFDFDFEESADQDRGDREDYENGDFDFEESADQNRGDREDYENRGGSDFEESGNRGRVSDFDVADDYEIDNISSDDEYQLGARRALRSAPSKNQFWNLAYETQLKHSNTADKINSAAETLEKGIIENTLAQKKLMQLYLQKASAEAKEAKLKQKSAALDFKRKQQILFPDDDEEDDDDDEDDEDAYDEEIH